MSDFGLNPVALIPYETQMDMVPRRIDLRTCMEAGMKEGYLVKTCQHYQITLGELKDLVVVRNTWRSSIPFLVKLRKQLIIRGDKRMTEVSIPQLMDEFYTVRQNLCLSYDSISIQAMLECFWRFDEMPLSGGELADRIHQIQEAVQTEYMGSSVKWFVARAEELQERCGVVTFEEVVRSFVTDSMIRQRSIPDFESVIAPKDAADL